MCVHAVRAIGTKAKHVIRADFDGIIVPKHALTCSELAEALIVVRAPLLLLCFQPLLRLGMAVNAVFLLVANTV